MDCADFGQGFRRVDLPQSPDEITIPAKAAGLSCLSVILGRSSTTELAALLGEIEVLLTTMLELPTEYHWMVDKDRYGVSGPYDGSWKILRRLAVQGLNMMGATVQPPALSFTDLIELGRFSTWKIVPASDQ